MDWIQGTMEWAQSLLEQRGYGPAALPFALVLGLVSALASTCCTLPLVAAIAGYAGARAQRGHRHRFLAAFAFMAGTILALIVLGTVAGLVGQAAQDLLGRYWKAFAGLLAVAMGLITLKLLPFRLPAAASTDTERPPGLLGAAAFGLIMGGASASPPWAATPGSSSCWAWSSCRDTPWEDCCSWPPTPWASAYP